jgi:hypothetical protein
MNNELSQDSLHQLVKQFSNLNISKPPSNFQIIKDSVSQINNITTPQTISFTKSQKNPTCDQIIIQLVWQEFYKILRKKCIACQNQNKYICYFSSQTSSAHIDRIYKGHTCTNKLDLNHLDSFKQSCLNLETNYKSEIKKLEKVLLDDFQEKM